VNTIRRTYAFAHLVVASVAVFALCSTSAHGQSTPPRVSSSSFQYLGSFKVPSVAGNGFTYGGSALAFNPARRSLYIVGHVHDQDVAEISIPAIGGTATVLQPLRDALGGRLSSIGSGQSRIGGQLVHNGRLHLSGFLFYDAEGSQRLSHFVRSTDLTVAGVTGPVSVGSLGAGFYSGYMAPVPSEWQSRLGGPAITGNCCLSIISRTSFGPAAFAFDPDNPQAGARPLVYYTDQHQTLGRYGASGSNPVFNGTTRITGVFLPQGTSSLVFFGSTGIGNYCYGEAAECGDPTNNWKGEHAYPYRAYMWAYDVNDLIAVREGRSAPWDVRPYATWELPDFGAVGADFATGGAAYDEASKTLYLSEIVGDGEKPLIHVYRLAVQTAPPPAAPANVRAQ
jgi:hypothetical protein